MRLAPLAMLAAAAFAAPRQAVEYGRVALHFEPNVGQYGSDVEWAARGGGMTVALEGPRARMKLRGVREAVTMRLNGAREDVAYEGLERLPGVSNYYYGNNRTRWREAVPHYSRVRAKEVYPGIDVVYYGAGPKIEYDFVVAVGGDPGVIELAWEGVDGVRLEESSGDIVLAVAGGELRQHKPRVYQEVLGRRVEVAAAYRVRGARVGFELASYDASLPVVIDPVLSYATYLGGAGSDIGNDIAVDAIGSAYVTGYTQSLDFPTAAAADGSLGGSTDAVVTKFNPTGTALVYSTYIGGSLEDIGRAIAVDASGSAYITGYTQSTDLPTASPVQASFGGVRDAYVTKLGPAGTMAYSTYLGGTLEDDGDDIAVDGIGAVYVTGNTASANFPVMNAFRTGISAGKDAFVAKLSPGGSSLAFSTFFGGTLDDEGTGIAIDGAGAVYVCGHTRSANIPLEKPLFDMLPMARPPAFLGDWNMALFVAKFVPAGNLLAFSSYLGGTDLDLFPAIAVGNDGSVYLTGQTRSNDFPLRNPFQAAKPPSESAAFLTKLSADGQSIIYSTYLAGNGGTVAVSITLAGDEPIITGGTQKDGFPFQASAIIPAFQSDSFATRFAAAGDALVYSTALGGGGGAGVAVDAAGSIYVVGSIIAAQVLPSAPGFDPTANGFHDISVLKLSAGLPPVSITVATEPPGLRVDLDGRPVTGPFTEIWQPGVTHTLSAPAQQGSGAMLYFFDSWSQGGPALQNVASPASTATYTARYRTSLGSLAAPAVVSPAAGQVFNFQGITFRWTQVAGATGYDLRVFRTTQPDQVVFAGTAAGETTLVSLPLGDYDFFVRACAGGFENQHCGPYAGVRFQVVLDMPAGFALINFPPEGAVLNTSTHELKWTAVQGATTYEVEIIPIPFDFSQRRILKVRVPGTSTIISLASGGYALTVKPCSGICGSSGQLRQFRVQLPPVPTASPTVTNLWVSGGNQLNVAWLPVANADIYIVQVVQPAAGPGGGALTVASARTANTNATLAVPVGAASVIVAACNGDGCGPYGQAFRINPAGPNPAAPILATPIPGSVVDGPAVYFAWSAIPGDNGSNTSYRLYVQDFARNTAALDVLTPNPFHAAFLKAEGNRYDALVVANPGPGQVQGPPAGFVVRGDTPPAPTMSAPTHQGQVRAGMVQISWGPITLGGLYEYFVAVSGQAQPVAHGVTPGLTVLAPLAALNGQATQYTAIVRACLPAPMTCVFGSEAGWGPWSNAAGTGVTTFTVVP